MRYCIWIGLGATDFAERDVMKFIRFSVVIVLCALGSLLSAQEKPARILAMGDSLMAWHNISGRSIAHSVAKDLKEPVVNRSIGGARVLYGLPITGAMGMKIANQYSPGDWEWVILNGGGNDLWLGCGCGACDTRMNRMISQDGTSGQIPKTVTEIRSSGAQVVYIGYLRSPGVGSIIEGCKDEGDELEKRVAQAAKLDKGFHFVSLQDLVPYGDRSYHGIDMIHPSVKASSEIGRRVSKVIKAND